MKQGWEIKKLGEVCEIQGGSTPKRTESLYWEGGTYPWFTIEDIREQGRIITDTKQKVTKVAWDKLRVFPKDTVLLCCTASIGEYAITHIPLTSNQQFNGLMIKDKSYLSPMYLMHYCATLKEKLSSLSGKVTIDFVSAEKVRQITIPVPPREEQERIVAELDCLSGVIERKREQLKQLDALAQSIFYQMFGDPITNEKGWEVKKLGEVCKTTSGGTPSKGHNEYYEGGTIPWLRSGEVNKMYIYDTELFITEEGLQNSSAKWFPENTVVVAMYGATVGQVGILKNKMTTNQAICGIFPNEDFVPIYLYHFLLSKKEEYLKLAAGGAQPNISQNIVRDTLVCCPSIATQQDFAEKIEAIEKQKELIKQSITQTEELFNSRMSYYFN